MNSMMGDNRRLVTYLIVCNFLLYFGFQFWQTTFNNFAVEELGAGPESIGLVQALRELPGLLGFLLGLLALVLSEVRIMSLSLVLLGVGIFATGYASSIPMLIATTLIMSIGFHFFGPSSSAVVLMAAKREHSPRMLGALASQSAIASVVASALVFFLAGPWGYRTLFLLIGGIIIVGGLFLLVAFRNGTDALPPKRRVVLRRRYWLFYALSFLLGSRRHIFTTFAIFLLVREYGITVQTTAVLFLINSVVNIFTYRAAGNLVTRFGERRILSAMFATLIFVFIGYAYLKSLWILYALFIADNAMFGFGIGLTTYFQKIAVTQEEITSNLSVEQTINHISAIIVPLAGGTIWALYGSQMPFLAGVFIAVAALALSQLIRTEAEPAPEPVPVG